MDIAARVNRLKLSAASNEVPVNVNQGADSDDGSTGDHEITGDMNGRISDGQCAAEEERGTRRAPSCAELGSLFLSDQGQ